MRLSLIMSTEFRRRVGLRKCVLICVWVFRYWAVTSIDYIHHRNPSRILTMIVLIWLLALLVSLVSLFWKDPEWYERLEQNNCLVSQSLSYQIFGTLASFYVPLAVILFLYYRIYETARKRIRRRPTKPPTGGLLQPQRTTTTSLMNSPSPEKSALLNSSSASNGGRSGGPTPETTPLRATLARGGGVKNKRETMESKRERKAAKTLAIITGAFIICWLPFFVMALHDAICPPLTCSYRLPDMVAPVLLWLGYFNSTLNPIIYTIFSPEFRLAFKKILFGRHYATRGGGSGSGNPPVPV
jgi:5-hydroxytryptamine receptor 1